MSSLSEKSLSEKMRQDWDARARENARYYVANGRRDWNDEDFFASGEETVKGYIATDPINICQGREPSTMRVLEIGCGAGRVTRALSKMFGEVHAVDVSGEMVERARIALADRPNVHLYQNNGFDLSVIPPAEFDFAFSFIVFQHIPSYEVIENYVREVFRLLRPGALFKFQVQGCPGTDPQVADDTWNGVAFSEAQAKEMAQRCGFEHRYSYDAGKQLFWLWFFKPAPQKVLSLPEQLEKMRHDWDERARENAKHYVANCQEEWTDEDFYASGEKSVAGDILGDRERVFQGKDPASMRVLEIGCGAGRLTSALSKIFGEVHAVDISGEMIARARAALGTRPNVFLYQNNGCDLSVIPPVEFDFAYSYIVFQHIPSYEVIENYVREVHRLLKPGALFKFSVQGYTRMGTPAPDDTWHGVGFSEEQIKEMAARCGFEVLHSTGAGGQYYWLWFVKRT